MHLQFRVFSDLTALDAEAIADRSNKAENEVAFQAAKDTQEYVPMLTGSLNNRTYVKGNTVIYPGPYARYLYHGKRMVNEKTGKGPAYIPDVGYRYKKGARLKPTEDELKYTKDSHPLAQKQWFEASKKKNMKKWLNIAKEAIAPNGE